MSENEDIMMQSTASGKRPHRTRKGQADLWDVPDVIASPTLPQYRYSLMLVEDSGGPHIIPISKDCKVYFDPETLQMTCDGQDITQIPVAGVQRQDILDIDMITLRGLYSVLKKGIQDEMDKGNYNIDDLGFPIVQVYVPEIMGKMGMKRNPGETAVRALLNRLKSYDHLIGVIEVDKNGQTYRNFYPVLVWMGYEEETNTFKFAAPYLTQVIQSIAKDSVKRDKSGKAVLDKDGDEVQKLNHHYLLKQSICSVRNKYAVEIVDAICQLLTACGKGGNSTPHISATTILSRCPQLSWTLSQPIVTTDENGCRIERPKSISNKNTILKRAFTKALEILPSQTKILDTYPGIRLPDSRDSKNIPKMSTLKETVYVFQHSGSKGQSGGYGSTGSDGVGGADENQVD